MYEQLCRYMEKEYAAKKDCFTLHHIRMWIHHYHTQYIKEMEEGEIIAMWKAAQNLYIQMQQGEIRKKRFYKCEGMKSLTWRSFPLASCMLDEGQQAVSIDRHKMITHMKIWYVKQRVYVEIQYRMY